MIIKMNETKLATLEQIRQFLAATSDVTFTIPADDAQLRAFVGMVIRRFLYERRWRSERGVLYAYMRRLSGYSRQHLSRLIAQYRDTLSLELASRASRTSFSRKYDAADVRLLAATETDSLHDALSGPATKVLLQRAYSLFGDLRF
jgi:hypothetical protein